MKEKNNQQENSFEFLSDQPLSAKELENIRFGHEGIAETLHTIVMKCPTPFTIGLFGKWGVGKTTIINLLRDRLQQSNVASTYFDVWKYENDSLRRQFLLSLESDLKRIKQLPDNFSLDKTLQATVSTQIESGRKLDFFLLGPYWILIAIFLLPFIFLWGYGAVTQGWSIDRLTSLVGWSALTTLLLGLVSMLSRAVKTTIETETVDRLNSPEEFEMQFNKLLENIKTDKLLINIDNLDRCSHDCAVTLLSTLKTFLEISGQRKRNKVVFLIPCDDEAIKKHLDNVYLKNQEISDDSASNADEFLRKFFNAFLRLPEFIGAELDDYTRELLRKTKVKEFDDDSVTWIATKAFRDNPRQIKQFINTLLSHYLLAKQRESGGNPLIQKAGAITKNVFFLAKFLIMLQKFPNAMKHLDEYSVELSEVITDPEGFKESKEALEKEFDNFKEFLIETQHIDTDNIDLFFKFKQSEEELKIPGAEELIIALRDNKIEDVKEKLFKLKSSKEDLNNFEKLVISQLAQNKYKPMNLVGIISSSLSSLNALQVKFRPNFYRDTGNTVKLNLLPYLHEIKPSIIFEELLVYDQPSRNPILKYYAEILVDQTREDPLLEITREFVCELFEMIAKYEKWFSRENLRKKISDTLAAAYIADPKVAGLFKQNPGAQKRFITNDVLDKFVASISDDEVENKDLFTEKIDLFLSFDKSIISEVVVQSLVQKIKELILGEAPKPYPEREYIKENLLEKSCEILSEFGSLVKEEKVLVVFSDTVIQSTDAIGDWTQKRIFIPILLKLVNFVPESKGQEIDSRIQQFFTSTSLEGIKHVLGKVENKSGLIQQYFSIFGQRVLQDKSFFDLLYPEAPKDIRTQWIIDLIQQNPEMALTKIEELKYKIDDKKAIIGTLLQEVDRSGYQEKDRFYKAVNEMRCAGDASLRSTLATQIKILLRNLDQNSQLVGLKAYQGAIHLSALLKREISREAVEWLRTLDPSNAYQPSSTRSILVNWDNLEEPVKRDFLDFVFNKLINRGTSEQSINLGFEILVDKQPKYEEYKTYYDDVYAKTESEGNEQLKHAIVKGLKALIPSRINKKNKEFWSKAKELP